MLGWGVLAGPIYLGAGLALALTRDEFDLSRHALSLLMLGEYGWLQRTNLAVSGTLCIVAAVAIHRAMTRVGGTEWVARLTGLFAVGLIGSSVFAPDPMRGFPPGAPELVSTSGLLHMTFGAVQFSCLGLAALRLARWDAVRGDRSWSRASRALGSVILTGFVAGAALGQTHVGVGILWLAVVASYAWLAATCVHLWSIVPHPDLRRR